MVLLLTLACADMAFTLGGEAAARPTSWPDTGSDTSADTAADTSGDSGGDSSGEDTSLSPPLASIYELGEVVSASSVYYADWLSAGDVNGDGLTDIVASVFDNWKWTRGNLDHDFDLLLSDGTGGYTLTTATIGLLGDLPMATAIADFDGDGDGDLAVARTTGVTLFRFDGTTLTDQVDFPVGETRHVRAGDLDGDGDPDLVSLMVGEALVLINDGTGTFAEGTRVSTLNTNLYPGSMNQIRLVDFDTDGKLDLYTTGDPWYGVPVQVNLGVGDGTFGAAITSFPDMPYPYELRVADFDSDGMNEVAFIEGNYLQQLSVGEWTGTVSSVVDYGVPFYGMSWMGQADVDGDGDADLLGYDGYDGAVMLQEATGLSWQPTFHMAEEGIAGGPGLELYLTGNANNDGCDDLFAYDAGSGYRLSLSQAPGCAGIEGGEDEDTADTDGEDTEAVDTDDSDTSAFTDGDGDSHRRHGCASVDGSALGALGVLLAALGARRRRA